MMVPTWMGMQMHMLGGMFAPHNRVTLMAMTSYQQRAMEMEGAHRHAHGRHEQPVGHHEMSSAPTRPNPAGDVKLEALFTLWQKTRLDTSQWAAFVGLQYTKVGWQYAFHL